jgi:CO/xanthine dehydrogenase FAD-binding subunit
MTYLTTALEPAEILTEVRLPAPPAGAGWSFLELARRQGDFALAGAGALLTLDESGACEEARIVLFGVAPTPVRATEAERALLGQRADSATFEEAGRLAAASLEEPLSDVHASSEFRRHLAGVLTCRALSEATGRAREVQ